MSMPEKFYTESLYPIQDGVISLISALHTPFYLTGGTALSRAYFGHRFSDDLDFFVNSSDGFERCVADIFSSLKNSYCFTADVTSHDYIQINISVDTVRLKIDFVNDIAVHYGEIVEHPRFGRLDSLINILTNKVTALYRYEAKDVADIWAISKKMNFNWAAVLDQAMQKEAGVEALLVSEIIGTAPIDMLQSVKWALPVDCRQVAGDLKIVAREILEGTDNSLAAV